MTAASKRGGQTSARDVDAFLAAVPEEARATLEKLRKAIRAAVPEATEAISYGVPAFKHQGRPLVAFGATKNHCAFYLMSPAVMDAHAAELGEYDTSKGTIRFPHDKPLPSALVTSSSRRASSRTKPAGADTEVRRAGVSPSAVPGSRPGSHGTSWPGIARTPAR